MYIHCQPCIPKSAGWWTVTPPIVSVVPIRSKKYESLGLTNWATGVAMKNQDRALRGRGGEPVGQVDDHSREEPGLGQAQKEPHP